MSNDTLSIRENIRHLSILILAIVAMVFPGRLQFVLLLSWIGIILVDGNVRHLQFDNNLMRFVRMTLYFLPFALPTLIFLKINIELNAKTLIFCVVSVVVFFIWLTINFKSIRVALSDVIIANTPKESRYILFLKGYNAVGATICEELFFRGFILSLDLPLWIAIPISSVYFMLSHYIVPWGATFSRSDHLNQLVFGAISVALFILSGSILPSIVLHLLLNLPTLAKIVHVFIRHYVRKAHYDKLLLESDSLDSLTL